MVQAANQTATARRVFPDSGPTRSFHCSQSFSVALASARVVNRPSANAPMPAAMIAAEIGPSGLSATGGIVLRNRRGAVDAFVTTDRALPPGTREAVPTAVRARLALYTPHWQSPE